VSELADEHDLGSCLKSDGALLYGKALFWFLVALNHVLTINSYGIKISLAKRETKIISK
jgi:hypothetical protein